MSLLITILLGALVGWLASIIMKKDGRMGWVANVVCGIVGFWLGGALFGAFFPGGAELAFGFSLGGFIASLLGACIVIWLYFLLIDRS